MCECALLRKTPQRSRKCPACQRKTSGKKTGDFTFLEKYFDHDKAVQQFPHLALNDLQRKQAVAVRAIMLLDRELVATESNGAAAVRSRKLAVASAKLASDRQVQESARTALDARKDLEAKGLFQTTRHVPFNLERSRGNISALRRKDTVPETPDSQVPSRPYSAVPARRPCSAMRPSSARPRSTASIGPSSGFTVWFKRAQADSNSPSPFLLQPELVGDQLLEQDISLLPDWNGWSYTCGDVDTLIRFPIPGVSSRPTSAIDDGKRHFFKKGKQNDVSNESIPRKGSPNPPVSSATLTSKLQAKIQAFARQLDSNITEDRGNGEVEDVESVESTTYIGAQSEVEYDWNATKFSFLHAA